MALELKSALLEALFDLMLRSHRARFGRAFNANGVHISPFLVLSLFLYSTDLKVSAGQSYRNHSSHLIFHLLVSMKWISRFGSQMPQHDVCILPQEDEH